MFLVMSLTMIVMNNVMIWVLFGILVSLFMTVLDLPVRFNRSLFSLLIGVVGSVLGGMVAYFIYGIELQGVNIAVLTVVISASVAAVLLVKLAGVTFEHTAAGEFLRNLRTGAGMWVRAWFIQPKKGGEYHAG